MPPQPVARGPCAPTRLCGHGDAGLVAPRQAHAVVGGLVEDQAGAAVSPVVGEQHDGLRACQAASSSWYKRRQRGSRAERAGCVRPNGRAP